MLKINKLEIEIIDENNEKWGSSFTFPDKLSVIIGENTVGKSTIINSIYYALGLEELLGYRDSKAMKPVLREKIDTDKSGKEEVKIKDSFVSLEIENQFSEKITLKRSIKSSIGISENLISVFQEETGKILKKDYFLKKDSLANEKGFFHFFENFLNIKLPEVLSYENKKTKLYFQDIFSALFVEQVGGWADLLETIPSYYKIIHPKRRVVEFILGLKANEIILKKVEISSLRKECLQKLSVIYEKIEYLKKSSFIKIDNFNKEYKDFNIEDIELNIIKVTSEIVPLDEYLKELITKIEDVKKNNQSINFNDSISELKKNIGRIQSKLIINQKKIRDLEDEISSLERQKKSTLDDRTEIIKEIKNFKDIEKLKKLGSQEKLEITKCPYCDREMSETLYSTSMNVMSAEENIKYLEEKRKILILTENILSENIENIEKNISLLKEETENLFRELTILNNDLPVISLQKETLRKEFNMISELNFLEKSKIEIKESLEEYNTITKQIKDYDSLLEELPKNNLTKDDERILNDFEKEIISNLKILEIMETDLNKIKISKETYFPVIEKFNTRVHISASDFIRLEWAYYISLIKNSIFEKNILIFDEPAQQNIDITSIKKLFNILKELNKAQIIVSYAVSKIHQKEVIKFFKENNIQYFLIENASIKKIK